VSGNSSAECEQEINQAASAAAAPKTTPPPPPAPKAAPAPAPTAKAETPQAKAQQKQLPKTGGSVASLFTLGVGVALITGGLLARRLVR
jgi:LPXTG-motif cell wall-anchored protein